MSNKIATLQTTDLFSIIMLFHPVLKVTFLILLVQFFVLPINQVQAQKKSTWVSLKGKKGNYGTKKTSITLKIKPYSSEKLKITINGGPIRIFNATIEYTNGAKTTRLIHRIFNHKKRSKVLSLKKRHTEIKSIKITYKRLVNHKQRPFFRVYGKK